MLPLALLVDDDHDFRWLARRWLARVGFEVAEAENGRAGLESLRRLRPALLVLDLEMPEMRGTELLDEANARGLLARTTVIVASGADHIVVKHHCYRLPKPVAPATFLLLAQGVRDTLVGAGGSRSPEAPLRVTPPTNTVHGVNTPSGVNTAHGANTVHDANTAHLTHTAHDANTAHAMESPARVLAAQELSPSDETSNDASKVAS